MAHYRKSLLALSVAASSLLLSGTGAAAENFPSRPITMIVPFAAGGAADITARIVAERMGAHLKQNVVVENVPGAGGTVGLSKLARSEPNGYTIGVGNNGTNAAVYPLYPDVTFAEDAFVPLGIVSKSFSAIAVKSDSPYQNIDSFIAAAKADPGKLTIGHAGIGSSNYLICLAFLDAAKVKATLVAYRGAAPAMNDMLGGQIDAVCDSSTSVSQYVKGGRAKALVVAGNERAPSLPDAPAAGEVNLPGFSMNSWIAIFAPKGTPAPIMKVLTQSVDDAIHDEKLLERYKSAGIYLPGKDQMGAAYLQKALPQEISFYKEMIAKAPKQE